MQRPTVDRRSVGISYSGGGPLLLVELGIGRAFVELGVQPDAIAGVSAGGIAAAAHALDPVNGAGIEAAISALSSVSNSTLGLTLPQIALHAIWETKHLASLGDNAAMKELVEGVFLRVTGRSQITIGDFGRDGRPRLIVGAADRLNARPTWFGDEVDVAEALIASAAIP